ncbi:MAG: 30S ribosomal protein S6 [Clostridiales bacterium]|nr:30S ribosomal protein S6 [Clostridiales bacterium]
MNKYEILYIIKNDVDDERKSALADKFADLVTTLGGTVDGVDKWGTKKFAYPINFMNEGYYVLMNFTAAPTVPAELDRQMKIIDDIVRQMIVRKD